MSSAIVQISEFSAIALLSNYIRTNLVEHVLLNVVRENRTVSVIDKFTAVQLKLEQRIHHSTAINGLEVDSILVLSELQLYCVWLSLLTVIYDNPVSHDLLLCDPTTVAFFVVQTNSEQGDFPIVSAKSP